MFIKKEAKITSKVTVSSEQELFLASCCLSLMRKNWVFEVLRVKRLADIQEDIGRREFWRWVILESRLAG